MTPDSSGYNSLEKAQNTGGSDYSHINVEGLDIGRSLDALPFYVMLIDANHRILFANNTMCRALKLDAKDVIGRYCPQLVHGVDHFKYCPLQQAIATEKGVEIEAFDAFHNRWLKPAIYPTGQFTDEGEPIFLHLTYDIDDQKKVSQELELKARLLDAATDSIFLTTPDGQIIYANENAFKTRGYTLTELISLNIKALRPPNALTTWEENRRKTVNSNEVIYETSHQRKNNAVFPVEVHAQTIRHDNQKMVLSVVRDITRRKIAECALKNIEERHRTILMTALDGFWMTDLDGRLLEVNDTYCRMSGYSMEELESMKVSDLEAHETIDETKKRIQHIREYGDARFETQHRRKDGNIYDVEISAQYRPVDDGYLVVFIRDITDQKLKEAENRRLREKSELSGRLAAIGEMAAGIAHEINNPLTSVIGFAELLLLEENLPENAAAEVKVIYEGSQRVKDIVARLLTFARQSSPEKIHTDLAEVIDNTIGLRSYVLKTSNIQVVKRYAPDLPRVKADPGQLQQVFLNLIVNAEYAMKQARNQGTLTLTTEQYGDNVRVLVTDDGTGIDEQIQQSIFQPFFTTKDTGEGTGLGLSLSFGIIQEHGGSIRVESQRGHGTTFVIELPAAHHPAGQLATAPVVENRRSENKARFLVIDDEPFVRALIQRLLVQNGHVVEECDEASRALDLLERNNYDVVLLDIRMPGTSGMELYDAICARWPWLAGCVIFITGDSSDVVIRDYLKTISIPVISKPFNRRTLEAAVDSLLLKLDKGKSPAAG
ncbi:MAG: PAS domain S-box protein [Dehalogenimonas sp.]|jgi:PAS domain S-box-containing protein|uniref:histidine kinase n=1 Tax=Candidatus Dehalogenimonas loeffleri TaxID=3127115 RepID=A0ABZ2J3B3_9CHLR|nr:PAS domain S-box protein [Dehalogenimonas sp.]